MAVDPTAVGRAIAHGAGDAQALAGAHGEHKATDVWASSWHGEGHQAFVTPLNLPPSDFSSTPLRDVPGALAMQAGDLGTAVSQIGKAQGALATTGAIFGALTSAEQLVSIAASAIPFPAFPAVRIMDMDIGLPHAHNHPPNLIPPAPPVPLPSTGPVIPIPYASGAATVLINGMPAGRCGDMGMGVFCGGFFPMYEIFLGSSSVWIEGMRAARIGVDITKHCVFSAPKPSDPPMGPMIGMTISASPNVMIGGVPMPSLTAMAIGAAMKVAFKGLGKLVGALKEARAFSRTLQLEMPGGMGGVASPRTPGLGASASLAELLEQRAIPGREGVILTDAVDDARKLYPDIFRLSDSNGIEYALTREEGDLVLRSGAPDRVSVPADSELLAHTHPPDDINGVQPRPSRADVNSLNDKWARDPNGPRPMSDVIWGSGPDDFTPFGATGTDRIPDPTKGGLKPGRAWT